MATKQEPITISPPDIREITLELEGTAPLMQNKFSEKAKAAMKTKMEAGSTSKKGSKREPRDFDADMRNATHYSEEGWVGIPAPAFRNACIDACRMAGYKMTHAKMSIFVVHDGLDASDGTPLVRLIAGDPERSEMAVRVKTSTDIRIRPLWRTWKVLLTLEFDAGQFTASDVVNLVNRAGRQVGIGEGRPFSKSGAGMGFGTFKVKGAVKPESKNHEINANSNETVQL